MGLQGFWRLVFVYVEGIVVNICIQLWVMLDSKAFLKTYVPAFAQDPVLEHPVVLLLARSWAYMIIVLGLIEISVLTWGSPKACACFLMAAGAGDLLHLLVFSSFFLDHGILDLSAMFGYVMAGGLFLLRCLWLLVFREQWSTEPKTLKEKDWTAVREVIKFDQLHSFHTTGWAQEARDETSNAAILVAGWRFLALDPGMINSSFLCDERLIRCRLELPHCASAAQQRMCAKATGEGIGEGIPLLEFFQCVYLQEVRIFGTHPDMLKQRRISQDVPFNSTKVVPSSFGNSLHFRPFKISWLPSKLFAKLVDCFKRFP